MHANMNEKNNQFGVRRRDGFLQRAGMVADSSKVGVGMFFKELYTLLKQTKEAFKIIADHWKKTK